MAKFLGVLFAALAPASALMAHGLSEADKAHMVSGGLIRFIDLGARHMVTGYDHLLFLLGVIFFLTNFKEILKFITVFTLGHSITLIAATYMEVTANYFLVDAVIALTVIYKGFDNIDGFKKFLGIASPNMLKLVFGFGLIHGFGLSTRLQQLPLGQEGLLARIIAFNVGVELGQVSALAIMILILAGWRRSPSFLRFSLASNVGLMFAGLALFFLQLHGYYHHSKEAGSQHDHPVLQASPLETSETEPETHNHDHPSHPHNHDPKSEPSKKPSPGNSDHSHGGHSHSH